MISGAQDFLQPGQTVVAVESPARKRSFEVAGGERAPSSSPLAADSVDHRESHRATKSTRGGHRWAHEVCRFTRRALDSTWLAFVGHYAAGRMSSRSCRRLSARLRSSSRLLRASGARCRTTLFYSEFFGVIFMILVLSHSSRVSSGLVGEISL